MYKLKKPVDFGFLDFTTLASRKLFCDEEMRLNRRLAPEVYLGVVEVKAHEGRIRLGGPGTTIDYAVEMRRLPEDRMLPTLLAEGQVTVDTMRRLARLRVYAQAEAAGLSTRPGRWRRSSRIGRRPSNKHAPTSHYHWHRRPTTRFGSVCSPSVASEKSCSANTSPRDASGMVTATCRQAYLFD